MRTRPRAAAARGVGIAASLLAATAAVHAETLEEAWGRALGHDAALAAATAESEAAAAGERAARGARLPQLEAGASYTRLSEAPSLEIDMPGGSVFRSPPIFEHDTAVLGSASLRLPLYTGGRIASGIEAARQSARAAREQEDSARSTLKLGVAQSYVDVLRSRRALAAAESSVASLKSHVADVQTMVENEAVARADLLAARVALADAEQGRVRAANAVALAEAAYNRLLGEPLDRKPELDERLPGQAALAARPVEELAATALERRSELVGLDAHARALAARARAESGSLLPQLALTAGYSRIGNQILDREQLTMVGAGFTWNLFDGGQARHRAVSLRAASRAARYRVEDLRSLVELEVREAWLAVAEARARVAASREAAAQGEENLRMARELYGAGLGTNTQVLEAVALQIAAANNRDDAQLDESLAQLRLAHAVGEL